jgi:hypothetical protein
MRLPRGIAKALGIVAAMVLPMLPVCGCRSNPVKPDQYVADTEKDLREHLPVGSSRSDVAAYLDQRGIEHSHIGSNQIEVAMIRDIAKGGLVRTDIQIVFKFDGTDTRLVSYSVHEVLTGP